MCILSIPSVINVYLHLLLKLYTLLEYLLAYVGRGMCAASVEVRRLVIGVGSFFLPYGSQGTEPMSSDLLGKHLHHWGIILAPKLHFNNLFFITEHQFYYYTYS